MGNTAAPTNDVDLGSTERLIQSVMSDQKRVTSRMTLPELEPVEAEEVTSAPRAQMQHSSAQRDTHMTERRSLKGRIRTYRPTRKHIVLAVVALVIVLRPWLIPGIMFDTFWVGLIAWLTLGPDRIT